MRSRWALGGILVLWCGALVLALDALTPRVSLCDDAGRALCSFPLYPGESFETEYIHSVQLCPVVDRYYADGRRLW